MLTKTKRVFSALSKHWVFTINNWTEKDLPDPTLFDYLIINKEVGGEKHTPHLQGYCVFRRRMRRSGVSKILPRARLAVKKGTVDEASHYCGKPHAGCICGCCEDARADEIENDILFEMAGEWGTKPLTKEQGSTLHNIDKWEQAWNMAKDNRIDEIPKDMAVRYYHSWKRIRQDYPKKLEHLEGTCGLWYIGPTEAGKSHKAWHTFPELYDKPLNKWWDGYLGEETVLLDDVGPKHAAWIGYYLKRWADKWSFPAEQKGSTTNIRPKRIIVTSQYTIRELFGEDPRACEAIERRFEVQVVQPWTNNPSKKRRVEQGVVEELAVDTCCHRSNTCNGFHGGVRDYGLCNFADHDHSQFEKREVTLTEVNANIERIYKAARERGEQDILLEEARIKNL